MPGMLRKHLKNYHVRQRKYRNVDIRSPKEFTGEILAPPQYPTEHAQRGGHIPVASNIPWSQAAKDDGTFKSVEDLKQIYHSKGIIITQKELLLRRKLSHTVK